MGIKITREPTIPDPRRLAQEAERAVEETVEFTKDLIVDHVETSGTDRAWSGTWFGRTHSGRGRVNTGEMRDAVRGEVDASGDVVRGQAGWFGNFPDYLKYQEEGFTHYITGEAIEGMKAIDAVFPEAQDEFIRQAGAAIERATR